MRWIAWQHFHTPTSIVGSIEAPSLAAAADLARVMCNGSFTIVAWEEAFTEQKVEAARRDLAADRAAFAALAT